MSGNTPLTAARVPVYVLDAVRARYGLAGATPSQVIRYALAVAAGLDPHPVVTLPMGPRPRKVKA